MIFLASLLEPMARIAAGGGPMKTMPALAQASANPGILGQEAVARMDGLRRRCCLAVAMILSATR